MHKLHGKCSPPLGLSAGTEPGFHASRHKCGLTFVARFSTMAGWGILLQAFRVLSDRRQQGHTSTSLLRSTCRFSFTSVLNSYLLPPQCNNHIDIYTYSIHIQADVHQHIYSSLLLTHTTPGTTMPIYSPRLSSQIKHPALFSLW